MASKQFAFISEVEWANISVTASSKKNAWKQLQNFIGQNYGCKMTLTNLKGWFTVVPIISIKEASKQKFALAP